MSREGRLLVLTTLVSLAVHAGVIGGVRPARASTRPPLRFVELVGVEPWPASPTAPASEMAPTALPASARPPTAPGGPRSTQNVEGEKPGGGGERIGAAEFVLLVSDASPVLLVDRARNALVSQISRIDTDRARGSRWDTRSTPNPSHEAFLASGEGRRPERRPVSSGAPRRGADTTRPAGAAGSPGAALAASARTGGSPPPRPPAARRPPRARARSIRTGGARRGRPTWRPAAPRWTGASRASRPVSGSRGPAIASTRSRSPPRSCGRGSTARLVKGAPRARAREGAASPALPARGISASREAAPPRRLPVRAASRRSPSIPRGTARGIPTRSARSTGTSSIHARVVSHAIRETSSTASRCGATGPSSARRGSSARAASKTSTEPRAKRSCARASRPCRRISHRRAHGSRSRSPCAS